MGIKKEFYMRRTLSSVTFYGLLLIVLLVSACQPTQVVVIVTATPISPTQVVMVVTATPSSPTQVSTVVPLPTATPVPPATATVAMPTDTDPTPTAESYSTDFGCAKLNPDWSDPVDGCLKLRNGNFTEGLTTTNGVAFPLRWRRWDNNGYTIPTNCGVTGCSFLISGTPSQAMSGLTQPLRAVEPGQCYLLKSQWNFRMRTSPELANGVNQGWPDDILFAVASVNGVMMDARLFTRDDSRPVAADGNFYSGTREFIWVGRGGGIPTPIVTLGLKTQWGSTQIGSTVNLTGAWVFAAPEAFCAGVTSRF